MPDHPVGTLSPAPVLRQRLAAEIAAGRTISLSAEEMADPELRRRLPGLLAELTGAGAAGASPGLHLPGYSVLGMIGQGGMSTVHLARQDTLGRYVALKVAAWSGTDRKKRDRLLQEARAMARVAHHNIVAIHDIVDVGDTVAIAMEWIDGLTLEALLRALPPQPGAGDMNIVREQLGVPPEAVANFDASPVRFFVGVMRDVARAVHRVHQAGLLHLDIKPSNVLVRRDGTPLLADFGVVREIELEATDTRSFAGTPLYCAPEQLRRNDRNFGPHTDVYGLGITLYELLARRQPLRGHGLTQLVQAIERGRVPPLGSQIAIAKDLETIVQKAMAPEPQHRYASAAELADDLDAFLAGRPVTARPLSRLRRAQRWARLEPWKATLLAVLLVTVPVVAFLGVELLLGRHHIEEGRLRERRQQADELKQAAYQERFARVINIATASEMLQQAMLLDPSDTSLACLVSMLMDDQPGAVAPLLAQHPDAVARSNGLRLVAKKAHENRPFFDPSEALELATSSQPIDWYVLALDRVLWSEDATDEASSATALLHIDAAAMGREPDPLLMGLRAWVAAQAGLLDVRDATCRALRVHWPDKTETMRWDYITHARNDPEAARAIATARIARDPHCVAAWELLLGGMWRTKQLEQGLALAEQARAVPVSSHLLDFYYVCLLIGNGRGDQGRAVLAGMPEASFTFPERLRLRQFESPAAARQLCDEQLASPQLSRHHLEYIVSRATDWRDLDLGERAFLRWQQDYPGYRRMYPFEMQRRYIANDPLGAARLARDITTPNHRIDSDGARLCALFATANYWPELAGFAERWLRFGAEQNRPQASFYAGLAASRQGDQPAAVQHLATATAAACTDTPTVWYTSALLERAWVLVAPAAPRSLRDPATASLLLERFEAANSALRNPRHGPWVDAITAEVRFAEGQVDLAIATAKAGLAADDDPRLAAPADCRQILQAALQRYSK